MRASTGGVWRRARHDTWYLAQTEFTYIRLYVYVCICGQPARGRVARGGKFVYTSGEAVRSAGEK
jgi:hypothetical protein